MANFVTNILGWLTDFGRSLAGFGHPSYFMITAVFVFFAVFLIGLTLGRTRILTLTLCIYAAAYLETNFPFFNQAKDAIRIANQKPDSWIHVGLFLVFYIIIFLILNHSVLKNRLSTKDSPLFQILILSFLNVGFLLSVVLTYLAGDKGLNLPTTLVNIFATKNAPLIWAVLPMIAIIFIKGKKELVSKYLPTKK